MDERYNIQVIKDRARQRMRPQSGVEQSQGYPYPAIPGAARVLETPADPGLSQKGWSNPYKMSFYGRPVPDQASASSIQALGSNFRRVYLIIQNKGPGNLFVNFGVEASANGLNCLQLVSTQVYEQIGGGGVFPDGNSTLITSFVTRDSIYILSDAANTTCVIGEGVWYPTKPFGIG